MVSGSGGYQTTDLFATTEIDIDLADPRLSAAIGNARLIRRELIDRHNLRYPEDPPIASEPFAGELGGRTFASLPFADLPFTLAACAHAKRISVLTDYAHYLHARRPHTDRVKSTASHEERVRQVAEIMSFTAVLIPPGPRRDAVNRRFFEVELAALLQTDLARLDRAERERVCADVGMLVELHLTDSIAARLDVGTRVRLALARRGRLDELLGVIREDAGPGPPIVAEADRLYLGYRCFRNPEFPLADRLFLLADAAASVVASRLELTDVTWDRGDDNEPVLTITLRSRLDLTAFGSAPVRLSVGPVPGEVAVQSLGEASGGLVHARFPFAAMVAEVPTTEARWPVRVQLDVHGSVCDVPLPVSSPLNAAASYRLRGSRRYRFRPHPSHDGFLVVDVARRRSPL
jgi:poly(ribitol-phosphate) beta-N-acetylglucosaminyltransferase